ncbi:hypothetical protein FisN_3Lh180 [Fistulifera solaris]|uniref:SANT domain-containing protein n=1 Tax=Fistulifera solaris TaxID=1519565 RepID=A0A1Z5JPP2_FISSO|nr:hypothetical protein FisN_3Lh180 [Fistulifera solaris]|eukprot:GAX15741.1 hypothetical protein FisN_3Lh180 [Fistulifera solaris]
MPSSDNKKGVTLEEHDTNKRSRTQGSDEQGIDQKRMRSDESTDTTTPVERTRWKVHRLTEEYVDFASNLMLTPISELGSYGYDPSKLQFPLEAVSALGYLKSPMRRSLVIEKWSPYEIAVFEAALIQHGKQFEKVQSEIGSKTTKEVIEFYYMWKKTSHYSSWKKKYIPPHLDDSDEETAPTK